MEFENGLTECKDLAMILNTKKISFCSLIEYGFDHITYFISITVAVPGRSPPHVAHPDVAPSGRAPSGFGPPDLDGQTWTVRPGSPYLAHRIFG